MLQVKFAKKTQKHILSFSKVLCAPSGEWLLPIHTDSVLWRRSNSSSATTLRWNFPQTFCVLNQQPFLLFVKILCALSIDSYSTSSKPVKTVPSLPSHLQRTSGNTSSIRARRTWELYVRTQLTKLNEFLGSSRSWRPNKTKSKENSLFPLPPKEWCFQPKPRIRTDSPEKTRHLRFWSSIFYLSSLPQLVALFYKWPQRRTNSV